MDSSKSGHARGFFAGYDAGTRPMRSQACACTRSARAALSAEPLRDVQERFRGRFLDGYLRGPAFAFRIPDCCASARSKNGLGVAANWRRVSRGAEGEACGVPLHEQREIVADANKWPAGEERVRDDSARG